MLRRWWWWRLGWWWKIYLWWSLCTLYLHACQMRVTIGDSGLCCCICVMCFERWLTPLCVDSVVVAEVVVVVLWWWWKCTSGRVCVPLYLHACHMRVTVGNSGLCCCIYVTCFECWLTPLCIDSVVAVVVLIVVAVVLNLGFALEAGYRHWQQQTQNLFWWWCFERQLTPLCVDSVVVVVVIAVAVVQNLGFVCEAGHIHDQQQKNKILF